MRPVLPESSFPRRSTLLGAVVAGVFGLVGCGANVSKTYESDVRFERCYGLDWKAEVDPDIRRRCWEEWLTYFAAGQTRDRIDYAKRQKESPDGLRVDLDLSPERPGLGAPLPEPISVFAPVPMMAASSPVPTASSASVSASAPAPAPRSECELRCDKTMPACLSGCGSSVCEQFCAQKHAQCEARCSPGGRGSTAR